MFYFVSLLPSKDVFVADQNQHGESRVYMANSSLPISEESQGRTQCRNLDAGPEAEAMEERCQAILIETVLQLRLPFPR